MVQLSAMDVQRAVPLRDGPLRLKRSPPTLENHDAVGQKMFSRKLKV